MKRILIAVCAGIAVLVCGALLAIYVWIDHDVKQNIIMVQQQYPGTAEDALISYLRDENNSAYDRTHTAIWTLGRIRSEKALPVLYEYYKDDPEGRTCYGRHETALCQYEIHKAIVAIEKVGWWSSHERLKQ
jgi:hypothetical protein